MVLVSGFRPADAEDEDGFIFDVMRDRRVEGQTENVRRRTDPQIWRQRWRHINRSGANVGAISIRSVHKYGSYPYLCTDRGQYILGMCARVSSNLARVLRDED